MTPDEILQAVLDMAPEELTAKVAELQHLYQHTRGFWRHKGTDEYWHDKTWSPPTRIADALLLLPELSERCDCDFGPDTVDYSLQLMRKDGKPCLDGCDCLPFFFKTWDELPLAITRAWVWWRWCEKVPPARDPANAGRGTADA